jgi:hypothetical protein
MGLQDAIIQAFGGSAADSETVSLIETVISNEANGKTGVPDFSFIPGLPSRFRPDGTRETGFGISILNPYLRAFIFQQENPYTFPIIVLGVGFLAIYGLARLIGD